MNWPHTMPSSRSRKSFVIGTYHQQGTAHVKFPNTSTRRHCQTNTTTTAAAWKSSSSAATWTATPYCHTRRMHPPFADRLPVSNREPEAPPTWQVPPAPVLPANEKQNSFPSSNAHPLSDSSKNSTLAKSHGVPVFTVDVRRIPPPSARSSPSNSSKNPATSSSPPPPAPRPPATTPWPPPSGSNASTSWNRFMERIHHRDPKITRPIRKITTVNPAAGARFRCRDDHRIPPGKSVSPVHRIRAHEQGYIERQWIPRPRRTAARDWICS